LTSITRIKDLLTVARAGERTLVMGVLNVTPDSFSDGGLYVDPDAAVDRAERMVDEGADILDVGGESTRPGSDPVTAEVELARVLPVLERFDKRLAIPVSIDTCKAEVARRAVAAGACMVNDVSGLTADPAMLRTVTELGVPVCIMHAQGSPKTMQDAPLYGDVVTEVRDWLARRADEVVAAGVAPECVVIDPGFGFGKTPAHNLELVRRLREIAALGYPVLLGPSRKSTIGAALGGLPVNERLEGTAAAVAIGIANGAAIVRVHDVREMARVARVTDAIVRGNWSG
jgi:dihydropteroate synthase